MKNAHLFSLLTALMLVLTLALTACGGASSAAPASAASATDTTAPAGSASVPSAPEEPAADPITFSGALRYSEGSNGSANSAGYYQIVTRADGVSSLLYTDFTTEQCVVLCNRPECTHSDDTCTAFVGNIFCLPVPIAQDDRLILLYPGWPSTGDEEAVFGHIETRDLNGANAKTVTTLPAEMELLLTCAADEENLYVLAKTVNPEKPGSLASRELVQINLTSGEMRTVTTFSADNSQSLMVIGAFDDTLLVKRIGVGGDFMDFFDDPTRDDFDAMIASQTHEILRIDAQGQEHLLASWGQYDAVGTVLGDHCYICDADGTVHQVDLRTGQDDFIMRIEEPFQPTIVSFPAKLGDKLLIDIPPQDYLPGQQQIARYAVDVNTGERQQLTQNTSYGGIVDPVQIVAQSAQKVLFISSMQSAGAQAAASYAVEGGIRYGYSILPEDAFVQNQPSNGEISWP